MDESTLTSKTVEFSKKYLKRAKKRRKRLVERLMTKQQDVITLYTWEDDEDDLSFSELSNWAPEGATHQGYLCIQYYDIFRSQANQIYRYVFFEIYFIGGVFSVLMKKSAFDNSQAGFSEFDMNRKEWAEAKQQMKLWQDIVPVKRIRMSQWPKSYKILDKYFAWLKTKKKKQVKQELATEFKNEDLALIEKIWPLLSYVGYAQLWPILRKTSKKLPLLNITCPDLDNNFENLVKQAVMDFCFHRPEVTAEDISVVYGGRGVPEHTSFRNIPIIFLLTQPSKSALQKIEVDISKRLPDTKDLWSFSVEKLPIIVQKEPIYVDGALNLSLDRASVLEYVEARELKEALKKMAASSLHKIILDFDEEWTRGSWHTLKRYIYDEKYPDFMVAKSAIESAFKKELSQNKEWWNEQSIVLLSEEYLRLASWISLMLPSDQIREKVHDWLIQEERQLQKVNDVLRLVAEEMLKLNIGEQPILSRKEDCVEEPFLKQPNEGNSTCIDFTPNAFRRFLQKLDMGKDADPKALKEMAYQQNLLHITTENKDWSINFKVQPDAEDQSSEQKKSSGKRHTIRCYAFYEDKLKTYLKGDYKDCNAE